MNRAERRAKVYRVPAQNLRQTQTVKRFTPHRLIVMNGASDGPMDALKAFIDSYEDPDAPAMSEQNLVLLCGLWLGLTRGLYLNETPIPRDEERTGNNILSRMYAGAAVSKVELQRLHALAAKVVNAAMRVKGWEVWAEAATDLAIKNEFSKRQSDSYWIGGWKHA